MTVKRIKLKLENINKFVHITTQCDFDIDISYNRYVIDAKSYLGIVALDLQQALTVSYDGSNELLETYLETIAVI